MDRLTFIKNTALTLGALSLPQYKILTTLFDDPWKIKMLRNDVGIFTERGGTIGFLISRDGIVVVDAQFPEQANHLIAELKKQSEKPLRTLINTHHHGDHTAGNIAFKGLVERVVAHKNSLQNQKIAAEKNNTVDKQLYPNSVYENDCNMRFGREKIKLNYWGPAHTNGDSIIHFQRANIVHMGDLMFNRRHPYIDRSAGANIKNWISILERASNHFDRDTLYIFGHAREGFDVTGTREDLLKFRDYLQKVLQFAQAEISAGKTKEEFIKNKSIPGVTEWTGDGIERPLTAAYEEVAAGN